MPAPTFYLSYFFVLQKTLVNLGITVKAKIFFGQISQRTLWLKLKMDFRHFLAQFYFHYLR